MRRGVFSIAGLAITAATVVLVQHLSLRPRATVANTRVPSAPEVVQKVAFCKTADGVRIAYTVSGQGPPVVQVLGWFTSVAGASGNIFASEAFLKQISARHLLVRYDGRGSGLSDRGLSDYSLEPRVRDLEAVVEALRLGRFALYGDSAGGAVSVAYAARYPERVTRLVLYGSYAGLITPSARQRETFQALITLMRNYWGSDNPAFRQIFMSLLVPDAGEADVHLFNEMERTSATSEDAAAQMSANSALDVRTLAPKVRAPTLVINRRGDRAAPFEGGRKLAALIPGARFMAAEGRNHVLLPGDPGAEQINDVILQFLDEDLAGK